MSVRKLELAIIARMLEDPSDLISCCAKLRAVDFASNDTSRIYAACHRMYANGHTCNSTTITTEVNDSDEILIKKISEAKKPGGNIQEYIKLLIDDSTRRATRGIASHAVAAAEHNSIPDGIGQLETAVYRLRSDFLDRGNRTSSSGSDSAELAELILPEVQGQHVAAAAGYPWPIEVPSISGVIPGLTHGELSVVAGYSGDGKSVFAMQSLISAASAGARVGYWSLEMPKLQVERRLVSMGGVPLRKLRDGGLDIEEQQRALDRLEQLKRLDYTVYSGSCTVAQVRAMQMRERYDVCIIDHLHRMPGSEDRDKLERHVRQCKDLALDLDTSVLALAQLARREDFPPPTTNQLRGTDVLTQEADTVLFVYRERRENIRQPYGKIIVAKVRDGEADFDVDVRFDPNVLMFRE